METSLRYLKRIRDMGDRYDGIYNGHHDFRALGMPLDDETVTLGDEYNVSVENGGKNVKAKSANITIDSLISINIKFKLENGAKASDYRFTINGKTAKAVKNGDAITDYLQAIVCARQGNTGMAGFFLRQAVEKEPSLAAYSANDLELSGVK